MRNWGAYEREEEKRKNDIYLYMKFSINNFKRKDKCSKEKGQINTTFIPQYSSRVRNRLLPLYPFSLIQKIYFS